MLSIMYSKLIAEFLECKLYEGSFEVNPMHIESMRLETSNKQYVAVRLASENICTGQVWC